MNHPVTLLDALWTFPLCLLAMSAPQLYIAWRRHAHRQQRLRCEWLGEPG